MSQHAAFDEFMETAYLEMMREVPELPMLMGILQVGAVPCPLDRFSLVSDEAIAARARLLESIAQRLAAFPRDSLSADRCLTAEVLDYFLSSGLEGPWIGSRGAEFARHAYLVNPGHGEPNRLLDALIQQHPFRQAEDAEDYLRRTDSLAEALGHITRQVAQRARRGILLPEPLLRRSIEEIRGMLALQAASHPIYRAFAEKSQALAEPERAHAPGRASSQRCTLLPARRQAMLEALARTLEQRVLPAYESLVRELEHRMGAAASELGLWRLPQGEAYYDFLLKASTTTELTAGEVHAIGLEHVSRLEGEIRSALTAAGLPSVDPIETLRQLESRTRFPPSTPREAVLERCESIVSDMRGKIPGLFRWLPEAPVLMDPVPPFSEDARHTMYLPSAADGSRPACMVINLRDVAADSELDLPTLLYHELFPGHHVQFSYAQQLTGLPAFRRTVTFDAYIEGWAKYAERLPWEHGFNSDPHWHAMRLRRELLSTANLVLDTGIHSRRWTLDQAADYLCGTTGCAPAFARSIALRSASVPAQLCAYKIGMLKVIELKERFARIRGAAFDIRDFHSAMLESGALPLRVLEGVIESAAHAAPAA
jgi:uncharacterized protein (DUF885 family)